MSYRMKELEPEPNRFYIAKIGGRYFEVEVVDATDRFEKLEVQGRPDLSRWYPYEYFFSKKTLMGRQEPRIHLVEQLIK